MKCLVVDDDVLSVKAVEVCISKTPFLSLAGSCFNAKDAIEFIRQNPVDLIFLD